MKIHISLIVGIIIIVINSLSGIIGVKFPSFVLWVGIFLTVIGAILSGRD